MTKKNNSYKYKKLYKTWTQADVEDLIDISVDGYYSLTAYIPASRSVLRMKSVLERLGLIEVEK